MTVKDQIVLLKESLEESLKSYPGHKGRPGKRGGSLPKGAVGSAVKKPAKSETAGPVFDNELFEHEKPARPSKAMANISKDFKHVRVPEGVKNLPAGIYEIAEYHYNQADANHWRKLQSDFDDWEVVGTDELTYVNVKRPASAKKAALERERFIYGD